MLKKIIIFLWENSLRIIREEVLIKDLVGIIGHSTKEGSIREAIVCKIRDLLPILFPMAPSVINHKAILWLNVLILVDFLSSIEVSILIVKLKLELLTKFSVLSILSILVLNQFQELMLKVSKKDKFSI